MADIPVKIVLEGLEEAEAGLRGLGSIAEEIKVEVTLDGIDEAEKGLRDLESIVEEITVEVQLEGLDEAEQGLRNLQSLAEDIPVRVDVLVEGLEEAEAGLRGLVDAAEDVRVQVVVEGFDDSGITAALASAEESAAGLTSGLITAQEAAAGLAESLLVAQEGAAGLAESFLAVEESISPLVDLFTSLIEQATAFAEIEFDVAGLEDVKENLESVGQAAAKASKDLGGLGQSMSKIATSSGAVAEDMAELGTAVGASTQAATAGFSAMVVGMAQVAQVSTEVVSQVGTIGEAVGTLSEQAGASVEQLGALGSAIQGAGSGVQAAEENVEDLGDQLEDVGAASAGAAEEQKNFADQSTKASAALDVGKLAFAETAAGLIKTAAAFFSLSAVVGSVRSTFHGLFEEFQEARGLGDVQEQTGILAQDLTKLSYAAEVTDTSLQGLTRGAAQLSRAYEAAREGSEKFSEAFAKLGISTTEVRDSNDLLLEVADAMQRLGPTAERTSLGMQVLGRSFISVVPLLAKGSEGLATLAQEAEQAGLVLDGFQIAGMGAVADNLDRIGKASDGLSTSFAAAASSGFAEFLDRIAKALLESDIDQKLAALGQSVGDAFAKAAEQESIGDVIATAITEGTPAILDAIATVLGQMTTTVLAAAPGVGLALVEGIATAILSSAPVAFGAIGATIGAVIGAAMGPAVVASLTASFGGGAAAAAVAAALGGPVLLGVVATAGLLLGTGFGDKIAEGIEHRVASIDVGDLFAEFARKSEEGADKSFLEGQAAATAKDAEGIKTAIAEIVASLDAVQEKRKRAILNKDAKAEEELTSAYDRQSIQLELLNGMLDNANSAARGFGAGLEYLTATEREAAATLGTLGAKLAESLIGMRAYGSAMAEAAAAAGDAPLSYNAMTEVIVAQTRATLESKKATEEQIVAQSNLIRSQRDQQQANQQLDVTNQTKQENEELEKQIQIRKDQADGIITAQQAEEQLTASQLRAKGVSDEAAASNGRLKAQLGGVNEAIQEGTAKTTAAASASKTLADAFKQQADSLTASIAETNNEIAVLEQLNAAGASGEEALLALADAHANYAAQVAETKGAEAGVVEAIRAGTAAYEERQRVLAGQRATRSAQEETQELQKQAAVYREIIAGTKSVADGEREIAVQRERSTGMSQQAAENVVKEREEVELLKEAATGVSDEYFKWNELIGDTLGQALDGVIAGTLNLGDTIKSAGVSLGKKLFQGIINEKLNFDSIFKKNIFDLGGVTQTALGGSFDGVIKTATSGFQGIGDLVGNIFGGGEFTSTPGFSFDDLIVGGGGAGGIGIGGNTLTPGGGVLAPGVSFDTTAGAGTGAAAGSTVGTYLGGAIGGAAVGATVGGLVGQLLSPIPNVPVNLLEFAAGGPGQMPAYRSAKAGQQGAFYGGIVGGAIGGIGAAAAGLGTTGALAGAVGGSLGPILGGAGAALGAASIVGLVVAVLGMVLAQVLQPNPTSGTLIRSFGEDIMEKSETFKGLRGSLGDFAKNSGVYTPRLPAEVRTIGPSPGPGEGRFPIQGIGVFVPAQEGRGVEGRVMDLPEETQAERTARIRALSGRYSGARDVDPKEVDEYIKTISGAGGGIFNVIFSQAEGVLPEEASRGADEMGRSLAEYFSRGFKEGLTMEEVLDLGKDSLRAFAKEAGVDVFAVLEQTNRQFEQFENRRLNYERGQGSEEETRKEAAKTIGLQQAASVEVFEADFAPGTQLGLQAILAMEKDGVAAFENLTQAQKEWINASLQDVGSAAEVYAILAEQGLEVNIEKMKELTMAAQESAVTIAPALQAAFETGDPAGAMLGVMEALGEKVKQSIGGIFTSELLDKTAIGTAFQPVFQVLDKVDEFDLTNLGEGVEGGFQDFKGQLLDGIIAGKANLETYLPMLKEMVAASKEIDEAIEEAFKPTTVEDFFLVMETMVKQNEEAVKGLTGQAFGAALQAPEGEKQEAARSTVKLSIAESVQGAAVSAAAEAASGKDSPAAKQLAELTTQFQFKMAAAVEGGISEAEKADLSAIYEQMQAAGLVLADGAAAAAEIVSDMLKDPIAQMEVLTKEAEGQVASATEGAAGAALSAGIIEGKSPEEVAATFGDSFRKSIAQNVMQGMQDALMQAAVLEGTLAPLMAKMKAATSEALVDGQIDAAEQSNLNKIVGEIKVATDQTVAQLTPTIQKMAETGDRLYTSAEEAKAAGEEAKKAAKEGRDEIGGMGADVDKVKDKAKDAKTSLEEATGAAAKGLKSLGDVISPSTAGGLKAGADALVSAMSPDVAGGIAKGMDAMKGALSTDVAAGIGTGMEAVRSALGAEVTGGISAGMNALKDGFVGATEIQGNMAAFADGMVGAGEIKTNLDALKAGMGGTGAIQTGMEQLKISLGPGIAGPIKAGTDAMKNALSPDVTAAITVGTEAMKTALRPDVMTGVTTGIEQLKLGLDEGPAIKLAAEAVTGAFEENVDPIQAAGAAIAGAMGENVTPITDAGGAVAGALNTIAGQIAAIQIGGTGGTSTTSSTTEEEQGDLGGIASASSFRGRGVNPNPPPTPPPPPPNPHRPILTVPPGWESPEDKAARENREKSESGKEETVSVSFNFGTAIEEFLSGGNLTDFQEAIKISSGEGLLAGMIEAIFSPDIEAATKKIGELLQEAKKDGIITPEEMAKVTAEAKKLGDQMEKDAIALKPLYKDVAEEFGVELKKSAASGIADGLKGGYAQFLAGDITADELREQMRQATFDGVIEGIIEAIMVSPAVEEAAEHFNDVFERVIADGEITAKEARQLTNAGEKLGDEILAGLAAAGPGIDALKKRLGVGGGKSLGDEIYGEIKGGISKAFLESKNPQEFVKSIKQSVYENLRAAIIDAFIESAMIKGVLAPYLAVLEDAGKKLAAGEITMEQYIAAVAAGSVVIAGAIETLAPVFTEFEKIDKDLQATFGIKAEETAKSARDTADAAEAAAEAIESVEAINRRQTVELGRISADELGAQAKAAFEFIVPTFSSNEAGESARQEFERKMIELLDRLLEEGVQATTYLDGVQVSEGVDTANRTRTRAGTKPPRRSNSGSVGARG